MRGGDAQADECHGRFDNEHRRPHWEFKRNQTHRSAGHGREFSTVKYLPRVFQYLKPHWKLGVLSVVLLVFTVVAGLLTPWPMKILVDSVLGNSPLTLPGALPRLLASLGGQRF